MEDICRADHFEASARCHRACAHLSQAPDIIAFHTELAIRFERLADDCRNLYQSPDQVEL